MNSERYSDMLGNQFNPAIRRQGRGLLCSGDCLQHDNGRHHTARQTVKQIQDFKLEVLTLTPYSPYFTPNEFLSLLDPKRRSTWTSLCIGWGSKGSGAWLTGTVNKRLIFPRNLYLSGTLVGVLRSWWELHYRLVSSYCIFFCSKSLYTIFPVSIWMSLVHIQSIVLTEELPRPWETLHFLDFNFLSPGWSYARIQPLD